MRVVYKYHLAHGINNFKVGTHPKIVLFGPDANQTLCVWIEHDVTDTSKMWKELALEFVGTGMEYGKGKHVMSCFNLPFIWHLLEH